MVNQWWESGNGAGSKRWFTTSFLQPVVGVRERCRLQALVHDILPSTSGGSQGTVQSPSAGSRHPSFNQWWESGNGAVSKRWFTTSFLQPVVGVREWCRLQALVHDILPSTTAVFSYIIGSRKLLANEQFFVGTQTALSVLQTTQIISDVCFITDHVAYASSNLTKIV